MHKCSCDQDTGTEMLSAKQKNRWDAKAWEFDDEDREGTARRRYEQDDEQARDMKSEVVIWLRMAGCACISGG
jgi:hypothetical protein